ncbi:beta-propeller fold lactonase family protein [Legionella sp. MW5194]|uniref:beta-propeller fold lactonase family protein n=1 Tax=Legionella sp. MW5194 TaxID=2662448 RepID=UPI00193CC5A9|nr:beta-propeller fold lactonase family protein [Legionella sp. MW5194]QRN04206.1 beta-propeller fold lactonase family protein [Legionella sp. MW5194]
MAQSKKNRGFAFLFFIAFSGCFQVIYAAQPKWTLLPTTPTRVVVGPNGTANVQYRVTNNTAITRTLTIKPLSGVTQVKNSAGECSIPFTLASKAHCLLTLRINGAQVPANGLHEGPVVCKTQGSGVDPFLCSQPSQANSLQVTVMNQSIQLQLTGSPLLLVAGGSSGNITVTNLSGQTALNVAAVLTGTALDGHVVQDASQCTLLAAGQSCNLVFTPDNTVIPATNVTIRGSNTTGVIGSIAVNAPPVANISISGSSTLQFNTNGSTGSITITNDSLTLVAQNIVPDFSATALAGNVSVTANTCINVLPGASCVITFAPGGNAVVPTNFPIQGTNTTAVIGTIGIDAHAYITNGNTSLVTQCSIDTSTGNLGGCGDSGAGGLVVPGGVTLNPAGALAYITNENTSVVSFCGVDADSGGLSGCANTGALFAIPTGIVINAAGDIAYVVNESGNSVTQCDINPTTDELDNCVELFGLGLFAPYNMAIHPAGDFAYITVISELTQCSINAGTGALQGCSNYNDPLLNIPQGIAVNAAGTLAYITSAGTNTVIACQIDSVSRLVTSCVDTGAVGLNFPREIALNGSNDFAYIVNTNGNSVTRCTIDNGTSFINCVDSGATGLAGPLGITIR